MTLDAVVLVPAAAHLLSALDMGLPANELGRSIAARRLTAVEYLQPLSNAETIVVVAPGPTGVATSAPLSLRPLGADDPSAPVLRAPPAGLAPALDVDERAVAEPEAEVLVLTRHAVTIAPHADLVVLTVEDSDVQRSVELGASLRAWAVGRDESVAVLGNGDLAATHDTTSPRYVLDGADALDSALASVAAGDRPFDEGLAVEARRHHARGVAAIAVFAGLLGGAEHAGVDSERDQVKGVGMLFARAASA